MKDLTPNPTHKMKDLTPNPLLTPNPTNPKDLTPNGS